MCESAQHYETFVFLEHRLQEAQELVEIALCCCLVPG